MAEIVAPLSACGVTDIMFLHSLGLGSPALRIRRGGHDNPAGHESLGVLEFLGQMQV